MQACMVCLLDSKNYRQALKFGYGIVAMSFFQLLEHVSDGSLTSRLIALHSCNAMQRSIALKNEWFLIVFINTEGNRTQTIVDLLKNLLRTVIPLKCFASQKLRKGANHVRVIWN